MASCSGGKLSVQNTCDAGSSGFAPMCQEDVLLPDNAMTEVPITETETQGSYLIIVTPNVTPGATAVFSASSGSPGVAGSVSRITSSPSPTSEEVDIVWNANETVSLYHSVTKAGGTGADISYCVRVV